MDNIPTKNPGDQYTSSEFNATNDDLKNAVTATAQTLGSGDPRQISKSMSNYTALGDFYNDTGTSNAYVLNVVAPKDGPTSLENGLRARFIAANSNTTASVITVAGFGGKDLKKYGGGVDLEAGDIIAGRNYEVVYVSSTDDFELVTIESPIVAESIPLFMTVVDMEIMPNATNPTTDIDIARGSFKDTLTFSAFTLTSGLTKELDNVWAEGTGAGGRPSTVALFIDTWYHVFVIAKSDGTVDAGFDTSLTATNLLADATGYTFFRRIGSIKTELATTDILNFYNKVSQFSGQREFYWSGNVAELTFSVTAPADSVDTFFTTITPFGLEIRADIIAKIDYNTSVNENNVVKLSVRSPLNIAPGSSIHDVASGAKNSNSIDGANGNYNDIFRHTNSSSQLIYRTTQLITFPTTVLVISFVTVGWIE